MLAREAEQENLNEIGEELGNMAIEELQPDDFVSFKTAMNENYKVDEQLVDQMFDSNSDSMENLKKIINK